MSSCLAFWYTVNVKHRIRLNKYFLKSYFGIFSVTTVGLQRLNPELLGYLALASQWPAHGALCGISGYRVLRQVQDTAQLATISNMVLDLKATNFL